MEFSFNFPSGIGIGFTTTDLGQIQAPIPAPDPILPATQIIGSNSNSNAIGGTVQNVPCLGNGNGC